MHNIHEWILSAFHMYDGLMEFIRFMGLDCWNLEYDVPVSIIFCVMES